MIRGCKQQRKSKNMKSKKTVKKSATKRAKATRKLPIELGCQARNKVNGFSGTVIGVIHYLTGCIHYGITSTQNDTRKTETLWYDESEIDRIGTGKVKLNERTTWDASPGEVPAKPSSQL